MMGCRVHGRVWRAGLNSQMLAPTQGRMWGLARRNNHSRGQKLKGLLMKLGDGRSNSNKCNLCNNNSNNSNSNYSSNSNNNSNSNYNSSSSNSGSCNNSIINSYSISINCCCSSNRHCSSSSNNHSNLSAIMIKCKSERWMKGS